jgi:uncharacterized membrane protein
LIGAATLPGFARVGGGCMGALVTLAFALHIAAGAVALLSGYVAMCAPKGGPVHRGSGNLFFAAMLVMATFAAVLAVARPGQIINLFIAGFAFYLVATAWLAARRPDGVAANAEKAALAVSLALCAPFALVSFQVATASPCSRPPSPSRARS